MAKRQNGKMSKWLYGNIARWQNSIGGIWGVLRKGAIGRFIADLLICSARYCDAVRRQMDGRSINQRIAQSISQAPDRRINQRTNAIINQKPRQSIYRV